jgi:hypothetical protein
VVPLAEAVSHPVPHEVVVATAVTLVVVGTPPTVIVWLAGFEAPCGSVNVSDVGLTVACEATINVTGIVSVGTLVALVMVIVPVYVPGSRLVEFVVICKLLGVVPELGATVSQVCPEGLVLAVAKKLIGVRTLSLLVSETGLVCVDGTIALAAWTTSDAPTLMTAEFTMFTVTFTTTGVLELLVVMSIAAVHVVGLKKLLKFEV